MGRDVLEEGGGGLKRGGGVWLGPPSSWGPLWPPLKAGQKNLSLNPFGAKGAEAKNLAVSLKHWKRRRGGEGGPGGLPPILLRCEAVLIHHCPRVLPSRTTDGAGS